MVRILLHTTSYVNLMPKAKYLTGCREPIRC